MSKNHQRDCKLGGTCDKVFHIVPGLVCICEDLDQVIPGENNIN